MLLFLSDVLQVTCNAVLSTVTRFARATGDLHSLSTADIKLIALARTLEVGRPRMLPPWRRIAKDTAVPVQTTCLQSSPVLLPQALHT